MASSRFLMAVHLITTYGCQRLHSLPFGFMRYSIPNKRSIDVPSISAFHYREQNQRFRCRFGLLSISGSSSQSRDRTYIQKSKPNESRVVIVGDVHGCKDEMIELLESCKFRAQSDRLIFVGDIVAKGPDSIGCLQFVKDIGAEVVLGNHEDKVLDITRALQQKEQPTSPNSEHALLAHQLLQHPDLHHFVASMPLFIRLPDHNNTIVVHAGMLPNTRPEDNTRQTLTRIRSIIRPAGDAAAAAAGGGPLVASPALGEAPWAAQWTGPETIVFGHDAVRGLQRHPFAVGLDTGCVYGGALSALILPAGEVVSVPARRAYCPIRAPAPAAATAAAAAAAARAGSCPAGGPG